MQINHNTHTDHLASPSKKGSRICRRQRTRAQSLVEFAIGAPLLLLLIFGIIDVARLVQARVSVSNAARTAIRFAVTGEQEQRAGTWISRTVSIRERAVSGLTGLVLSNTNDQNTGGFHAVEINPPDGGKSREIIEVTVSYNLDILTPLVNMIMPNARVRGYERAINEEWGPVQTFDHANIPPTPPPLPTWTPYRTMTPTPTQTTTITHTRTASATATSTRSATPTNTPTRTLTAIPTITATGSITPPTITPTGIVTLSPTTTRTNTVVPTATRTLTTIPTFTRTRTATPTPTRKLNVTVTATPRLKLMIQQIVAKKVDGNGKPLDIQVSVRDEQGATIDGATVSVTAEGNNKWTGTLPGIGGGLYKVCDVGSFSGKGGGHVTISVDVSKNGYWPDNGSAGETSGNMGGCP